MVQNGFGLIVGRVSGRNHLATQFHRCFVQKAVTRLAGRFLNSGSARIQCNVSDFGRNVVLDAELTDPDGIRITGLAAKMMIQVCHMKRQRTFATQGK
jgi:hypothetical protein